MDAAAAKATQHDIWTRGAARWRKRDAEIQARTAPVSARMTAGLKPGDRVLDVATGSGEPALTAAARVLPGGEVIGTDFVSEMLALAREKAAARGLRHVEFRLMDAEALEFPPASFDAATCRWGLMFLPDPHACLTRIHRALKPGARLTVTCWAAPDRNPWIGLPVAVIRRHVEVPAPPPGAPGPFAFADPDKLRAALAAAGFSNVAIESVELTMADFDTGAEFVDSILDAGGAMHDLIAQAPQELQQRIGAAIAQEAERAGGGRVHLNGVTWLATARR